MRVNTQKNDIVEHSTTDKTPVLPTDIHQAMRDLIRQSSRLLAFAEQETQTLIRGDHLGFAYLQRDKDMYATRYARASVEFQNRIEDFRKADPALLIQLESVQNALRDKTAENNVVIEKIKTKAAANTQATLFTAQEIGQRVHFAPRDDMPLQENTRQRG